MPSPRFQIPPLWVSSTVLLMANFLALGLAVRLQWNPLEVILTYCIQAVVIGISQSYKIRDMVEYGLRTGNVVRNYTNIRLLRPDAHKGFAAIYGLIWTVLVVAILLKFVIFSRVSVSIASILLVSLVFSISHWWSYRSNKDNDRKRSINMGNALTLPIMRLLPLYYISISVNAKHVYDSSTLVVWMLSKTLVDVGVHIYEHKRPAK